METPVYVPLASRAALAKALLVLAVAAQALAAFTSFELLHLADEIGQTGGPSIAGVDAIENRHALVRMLQLAVFAVAGLAFGRWFQRAHANLPALGERLRHPLLGAWSRTFGAAVILVVMGSVLWARGEAPIDLELAALTELVGNLLGVAAGVLGYVLVDRTTTRQAGRAASRALPPRPEPGPVGASEAV